MSKQQQAKEHQGYNPKPKPVTCATCEWYRSKIERGAVCGYAWTKETMRRCGLGGFAVKKTGTCGAWEPKGEA